MDILKADEETAVKWVNSTQPKEADAPDKKEEVAVPSALPGSRLGKSTPGRRRALRSVTRGPDA